MGSVLGHAPTSTVGLELEADPLIKIKLYKSTFQPKKRFVNWITVEQVMTISVTGV